MLPNTVGVQLGESDTNKLTREGTSRVELSKDARETSLRGSETPIVKVE